MVRVGRRGWLPLVGLSGVLFVGFALQSEPIRNIAIGNRATAARPIQLARALPAELPGWQKRDEPLGLSEFVQGSVAKSLNYDDYIYRIFEADGRQFSVYVAYWSPGRMPVNQVAAHTPDRCWSSAGWLCESMRHKVELESSSPVLCPGEWRLFMAPDGQRRHVLYWHLVGGNLYNYGERFNRVPSAWWWWHNAARQLFRGPSEQYFIRLTSDRPFEELAGDPGWEELLGALAKLGLAQR